MNPITRVRQAVAWRLRALRDRIMLARARAHRRRLKNTVFAAITGSAGKTTTKDLALSVLSRQGPTSGNAASLNYLADMARVLLDTKRSDRFAVIEIGASKPGQIDEKIALVHPTLAVLTVVQRDHIKNFDSVEAIAAEKGKLIHALPPDGMAILNIDDPLVRRIGEQARAQRIWFGTSADADIRLVEATSVFPEPLTLVIEYQGQLHTCRTGLHGTHLAVPVLAAIGLGLAVGMRIEACVDALAVVRTTPGRMEVVASADGITFLRDDYKAPYWAFQATLDYLRTARAARRVAVIGTLSDYSLSASKLYPKVARQALEAADLVVFVGPHALRALKARRGDDDRALVGFTEIEEAHQFLQKELRKGDLVLLKGSNRADHLIRLMLARTRSVRCWTNGCGLNRFCNVCPRLDLATARSVEAGAVPSPPEEQGDSGDAVSGASSPSLPVADARTWLIVGMGNHGDAYEGTPHNVGFATLDRLAQLLGLVWGIEPDGMICHARIGAHDVILFKPATVINLCGAAVERVRRRFGLSTNQVILVHDDLDLILGDARIKHDGSDGGHKGLRSVFSALASDGFMPRVRVGVRRPHENGKDAKTLVLQHFEAADSAALATGVSKATALLQAFITKG